MRVLRCLRDFEKWSWLGKMGKNEEKWGKKLGLESPFIHYYGQMYSVARQYIHAFCTFKCYV